MKLQFITLFIIGSALLLNCATSKQPHVESNANLEQKGQPTPVPVPTLDEQSELDSKLDDLTNQIINSLSEERKSKIAVIEFSDLRGDITDFGRFISEELITRLYMTQKFHVVERQLLNKILEEHKLTSTGLVDEKSAKELGKILGVEAIASGTVTDLVNSVKIHSRLISTETGSIFAVASVKIEKDTVIEKLMQQSGTISKEGEKSTSSKDIQKEGLLSPPHKPTPYIAFLHRWPWSTDDPRVVKIMIDYPQYIWQFKVEGNDLVVFEDETPIEFVSGSSILYAMFPSTGRQRFEIIGYLPDDRNTPVLYADDKPHIDPGETLYITPNVGFQKW